MPSAACGGTRLGHAATSVNESDALLRLALIPGLGPITASKLLEQVAHPAELFSWSMDRLQSVDGVGGERARRVCDPRGAESVATERARCHTAGVRIITWGEADYPQAFLSLSDPPLAIWLRGNLEPRDRLGISVVGPRRPSAYGHRQAHRLGTGMARIGTCLISGLARGIDTIAHEAALAAGARTIAVLGSGFDKLYPEENAPLAERIAAGNGAVISEFPMATPPSPGTFPRRNRLVAALGLGTLVIEAGQRSGALITARIAMELGREVLVVPGAIDNPECVGSNQLIRDGATLVASIDHILEEIEPLMTLSGGPSAQQPTESPRAASLSGREKQLYQLVDDAPRTVDDLVRVSSLPPSAVSATMLSLELRRLIRKTPTGFVRAT
jgi:DNA processing protein